MTQATQATPAKLRDGTWGARAPASVRVGDTVTITTRSGKSWDAIVDRVVWHDDKIALCSTTSMDRPRATSRSYGGGYDEGSSCGYPCPVTGRRCCADDPCHDCQ